MHFIFNYSAGLDKTQLLQQEQASNTISDFSSRKTQSSFEHELAQCSEMISQISTGDVRTLILLDELGSTSSHSQALPYMWALSENLLCFDSTLTLISTHNARLRLFSTAIYQMTGLITLNRF